MDEMKQYKIPASITLAQGILESGSGKRRLAVKANNHFGIKCHDWNGPKIYHDVDKNKLLRVFEIYKKNLNSYEEILNYIKIYFDKDVDLKLIKENLTSKQNRIQEEMNKISQRLENKSFVDRAPKDIVQQEKTNYSNLKNDIKKISLTIESL